MYTVKRKTVFTKSIKDGSIQTCYLMHITVDTVADIPDAKENWLAGSRCDVLEDGGHVYMLSNGREWVQVNFYNLGGESDSTDLSNYYTKSQIDERIVGQFYLVDNKIKGEIFNDYANNVASGEHSHAEGMSTLASGIKSHAEGYRTKATGECSHAEGYYTKATGECSHAEGYYTEATGDYSHAGGYATKAIGNHSYAMGYYTEALGRQSYVIGKYNIIDQNNKYAFIIGNGTLSSKRSNAFSIDWNGNIYVNNSSTPVNVLDLLNRISALEDKIAELENSAST